MVIAQTANILLCKSAVGLDADQRRNSLNMHIPPGSRICADQHEWRLTTPQGHTSISLNPAKGEHAARPHDRCSPGLHHFVWRAEARDDVDRFHGLLKDIGAEILDAPADYPQYNGGNGYYAVFFADADGLKLEYAWTPD